MQYFVTKHPPSVEIVKGNVIGFKTDGNERTRIVKDLRPGQALVSGLVEGDPDFWVNLDQCWFESEKPFVY
jgi:hypothetical protein